MIDREAWQATVHGITKSWIWLSTHAHTYMRETPTAWLSIDYYYIFNHIHGSYLVVNKISYFCRCEINISMSHSKCVISYWVIISFLIKDIIFNCYWSKAQNVWIQELSSILKIENIFPFVVFEYIKMLYMNLEVFLWGVILE